MCKDNKIRAEQAKILYQQSPIVLLAILLLVTLVISFFKSRLEQGFLIPWATWILILTSVRAYLIWSFHKQEKIDSPDNWLKLYTVTTFLSGISWGILLVQVLNPVSGNEVLILSFILTGMIAGALLPLSCYLPAYFVFSIPMLTPFAINMFSLEGIEFSSTGFLVLTFLVSMLGFSTLVNRNILDTIKLRINNIDLLEDLKAQKKLADSANSEKSRFLAATSHDLRQPLYALDLYLGALRTELQYPKQMELLDKVQISSKTLADLLNALMDVSKLDSGGVEVNAEYFDLMDVLLGICIEYEQQAKDKGIEIKASLDEALINTDPILLGRILRNLICNAINHNENCCLIVSTSLSNGKVTVNIIDSGKGISVKELDNIFSEFYQLNNPERDRNKGLGLGLAIVKRLTDLLNVAIEVESEVDKGTRFSLVLALAIDKRKIPRLKIIDSVDNIDLAGLFIIVIDDEKTVRDATKTLLRNWGCEVLSVSSQLELITTLSKDNYAVPDLVISDYRLADKKNGLDSVSAVYDYFMVEIPALIVTGDSSEKIVSEITASKYTLLLKPISSQMLRGQIERVLKG
ncbi:MAG: signal transduction histidine kinase/CheY-like chemotaxis protein [Methylophagaceae bacterium]|jgi:signal transduction histidine kinase/CheY-like chemotaxis protein